MIWPLARTVSGFVASCIKTNQEYKQPMHFLSCCVLTDDQGYLPFSSFKINGLMVIRCFKTENGRDLSPLFYRPDWHSEMCSSVMGEYMTAKGVEIMFVH